MARSGWSAPRPITAVAHRSGTHPERVDLAQLAARNALRPRPLVRASTDDSGMRSGDASSIVDAAAPVWQVTINNPAAPQPPVTIFNLPAGPSVTPRDSSADVDSAELRRQRLAAQVSQETRQRMRPSRGQTPWQSASQSLTAVQLMRSAQQRSERARQLWQRGAIYAAHEAAIDALEQLAAANDRRSGDTRASEALSAGLAAIREAGDFLGRYGEVDAGRMAGMVASHRTPILKHVELRTVAPLDAANGYLDFAREQLTRAVSGCREGAPALRVLAHIERARDCHPQPLGDAIALSCLRAAVATDTADAQLAAELGYEAMRVGLLGEARWALEHSLALRSSPATLQNLIETHRLAGETERARVLVAQLDAWGGAPAGRRLDVVQMPPQMFAQISPPVQNGPLVNAGQVGAATPHSRPAPSTPPAAQQGGGASAGENRPADVSVLDRMAGVLGKIWQ